MKSKKEIHTICLECGEKVDKKKKISMGVWKDTCDICGKKNTDCADAQHDFGYYNNEREQVVDEVQDLL